MTQMEKRLDGLQIRFMVDNKIEYAMNYWDYTPADVAQRTGLDVRDVVDLMTGVQWLRDQSYYIVSRMAAMFSMPAETVQEGLFLPRLECVVDDGAEVYLERVKAGTLYKEAAGDDEREELLLKAREQIKPYLIDVYCFLLNKRLELVGGEKIPYKKAELLTELPVSIPDREHIISSARTVDFNFTR